jgi:uncharacterized coiled-coil protein SlyX
MWSTSPSWMPPWRAMPPDNPSRPGSVQLLERQLALTEQMIDTNPFQVANASGTLEKIKNQMRKRADLDSAKSIGQIAAQPRMAGPAPLGCGADILE